MRKIRKKYLYFFFLFSSFVSIYKEVYLKMSNLVTITQSVCSSKGPLKALSYSPIKVPGHLLWGVTQTSLPGPCSHALVYKLFSLDVSSPISQYMVCVGLLHGWA